MTAKQQRRVTKRICQRRGHLPKANIDTGRVWCGRCGAELAAYKLKGTTT